MHVAQYMDESYNIVCPQKMGVPDVHYYLSPSYCTLVLPFANTLGFNSTLLRLVGFWMFVLGFTKQGK